MVFSAFLLLHSSSRPPALSPCVVRPSAFTEGRAGETHVLISQYSLCEILLKVKIKSHIEL